MEPNRKCKKKLLYDLWFRRDKKHKYLMCRNHEKRKKTMYPTIDQKYNRVYHSFFLYVIKEYL